METEVVSKTIELSPDLELMLNCAMRYVMGRRTYIVSVFCDYVKSIMPKLSLVTLERMQQDYENFGFEMNLKPDSWGDKIDMQKWMQFKTELDEEIKKRKGQNGK